jgi:hypothetical protein
MENVIRDKKAVYTAFLRLHRARVLCGNTYLRILEEAGEDSTMLLFMVVEIAKTLANTI